jgi:hypothetical protein
VHGVVTDASVSMDREAFGPTRTAWLRGITDGRDLMSLAQDEAFESMGEKRNKTELVSAGDGKTFHAGGIFEMRAGQTTSLGYREWRGFATTAAGFLMEMQKDPDGVLAQIERNDKIRALLQANK